MSNEEASPIRLRTERWRSHRRLLTALLAISVLVYGVDYQFLGPSHGGWITLSFRGWLIGAYLVWLFVHASLSTLVLASRDWSSASRIHAALLAIELTLASGGFFLWHTMDEAASEQQYRSVTDETRRLGELIRLEAWEIDEVERAVRVDLLLKRDARLVSLEVSASDETRAFAGSARSSSQLPLQAGTSSITIPFAEPFRNPVTFSIDLEVSFDDRSVNLLYDTDGEPAVDGHSIYRPVPPPRWKRAPTGEP